MLDWILNTWVVSTIIRPLVDVGILAFLIYQGYRILYQTRAVPLIRGTLYLGLLYLVALGFKLDTLLWILNFLGPGIIVGLTLVFQPELRKIFSQIGRGSWFSPRASAKSADVEQVLKAAEILAERKRGLLVAFTRRESLKNLASSGTTMDAQISHELITSIFAYDTALHDGSLVIEGDRIVSAGCFFSISNNPQLAQTFGTRHRAALGLSEESDAVVLIVSEESGAFSLAYGGVLHYNLPLDEIRRRLKELLNFKESEIPAGDPGEKNEK